MEIIIALLSNGVTEVIKLLSKKFGVELSKKIVHTIVFACVLTGTLLISKGIISWQTILDYIQIFSLAYTNYRLIVKPVKQALIEN